MKTQKKKKFKIGRIVIALVLFFIVYKTLFGEIELEAKIMVKKGASLSIITDELSFRDKMKLKLDMKLGGMEQVVLQPGQYVFSGSYTSKEFIEHIQKGPFKKYVSITVLEGWNSYDVDISAEKVLGLEKDAYLNAIVDPIIIQKFSQKYEFLKNVPNLVSLEGFLYPDTYFVDVGKDPLDQLLTLQLQTFDKKIYQPNKQKISEFSSRLRSQGFNFDMSWYSIVKLASVVEKEERNSKERPTIAGIFLNRIEEGMRLDADITLCYGLQIPYEECTPSKIVAYLKDDTNPYNTRAVPGIPPTPISNVSANSVESVLEFQKSDYIYYLHDNQGQIHYGKTYEDHNLNKSKYLNG